MYLIRLTGLCPHKSKQFLMDREDTVHGIGINFNECIIQFSER